MTPESARFLDNAGELLERGRLMLSVRLFADAGRAAYLACFHAAQAFIFEREQRVVKTHRGVQTEFHRLTRDEPRIPTDLRSFLSRAYVFKTIADYDLGSSIRASEVDARIAIETAVQFVNCIVGIIGGPKSKA